MQPLLFLDWRLALALHWLIFLIVQNDFSFYKFEKDASHTYRLVSDNGDE